MNNDFLKQIKLNTMILQKENKEFDREHSQVCKKRDSAEKLEKLEKYNSAINTYLENINFCRNSTRVNKVNIYLHDIERVIILYGKTKQTELLIEFLEDNINRYKTLPFVEKWKSKLIKLK